MDKCSKCGADTELYESGVPFCVGCSKEIDNARKQTAMERVSERLQMRLARHRILAHADEDFAGSVDPRRA